MSETHRTRHDTRPSVCERRDARETRATMAGGARDADGTLHVADDLGDVLDDPAWHARGPWRSHFHVPVFREELAGGLRSTQPELERALRVVAREGLTKHIEVETYTWDVLPDELRTDRSAAIARELRWVEERLAR